MTMPDKQQVLCQKYLSNYTESGLPQKLTVSWVSPWEVGTNQLWEVVYEWIHQANKADHPCY